MKAVKQLNPKVIQLSILFYFALVVPVSFAHELGHAMICNSSGHESSVHLDMRGMYTECKPDLETTWFYLAGPVTGASASASVVIAGLWIKSRKQSIGMALLVVGASYSVDQISKMVLEGFMTQDYQIGVFDVTITGVQIISLLAAIVIFARPSMTTACQPKSAENNGRVVKLD